MSGEQKDGGPAFPYAFHFPEQDGEPGGINLGMTLRDWFAGQALAGLAANQAHRAMSNGSDITATCAYDYADAMLAERAKKGAAS